MIFWSRSCIVLVSILGCDAWTNPGGSRSSGRETARYVGKVLHVHAGHRLSRQYHRVKEETLLCQSGEMDLEIGPPEGVEVRRMKKGDVFHVLPGTIHRMIAVTDTEIVEVSTPELDDVVRLEDVYGREGTSTP
jgi:mannose-6-phosphate isomerase